MAKHANPGSFRFDLLSRNDPPSSRLEIVPVHSCDPRTRPGTYMRVGNTRTRPEIAKYMCCNNEGCGTEGIFLRKGV